jgi:protocatechuate 4,5-dioxygenase alpha subunit
MSGRETEIPGTFVFTGERSQRGYRLNKLAMTLNQEANRSAFLADEEGYMSALGLSRDEMDLVRRRDFRAIIENGGNIYLVLKIAATVGSNLLKMGASMRGQSLDDFMATRPGAGAPVRSE